jgi:hypothetical protein
MAGFYRILWKVYGNSLVARFAMGHNINLHARGQSPERLWIRFPGCFPPCVGMKCGILDSSSPVSKWHPTGCRNS